MKPALPLIVLASLAACTVGPDYEAPTIGLMSRFAEGGAATDADVSLDRWWEGLDDATLNALADRGLRQNVDIATAMERINQAEAALRSTGAAALVSGDISGETTRAESQSGEIGTDSSATAAASLVIDLFGGEARLRQQAQAEFDASQLDMGTARLAFLSSLVGNYIDARYYQEAAAITRGLIDTRQQTVDLVGRQREAGLSTDLDVLQSRALLEETRANLPAYEQGFHSAVYAIATLLAEPAQPILDAMQRGSAQPWPPRSSEAGVPADLLRNRPDVRSAERAYAASVAAVGVAEASLYPSLDLSGSVTAGNPSTWSFGPTLALPVLNQPLLRANRDEAVSEARQAELSWRSAVYSAVEEVQIYQGSTQRTRREVSAQQAATDTYRQARDLSRETYEAGTTTFLDLLDAERSAGSTALSLASSIRDLATDWTELQVATGRGWAVEAAGD